MNDHFQGKDALSHILEARQKGQRASEETHGVETPGHVNAAADAAKETAFLLAAIAFLFENFEQMRWIFFSLVFGWLIWKTGRSALLGWARLERLHRLIEEERYEIEHHRGQEKEELTAMYAAKGFSGKLLEEAVEVMMADDNRLLEVMLIEELGLKLEVNEHPLKQATGALIGVLGAAAIFSLGLYLLPAWGPFAAAGLVIVFSAGTTAQLEKNRVLPAIVWNLGLAALSLGSIHFAVEWLNK